MKKVLAITISCLFVAYITFILLYLPKQTVQHESPMLELVYMDSLGQYLLPKETVLNFVENADTLSASRIENIMKQHVLVEYVECYETNNGHIKCMIWCKEPVLRVLANAGNFYLCRSGDFLSSEYIKVKLPVLTGCADTLMCKTWIAQLGTFIHDDPFWSEQVEQINVTGNGNVEIVPRIGKHLIFMGDNSNLENKFERLMNFYNNGLSKIGWNKYSTINLAFQNQIVCNLNKK